MYDLIIKNGRIVDGTGNPAFDGDIESVLDKDELLTNISVYWFRRVFVHRRACIMK